MPATGSASAKDSGAPGAPRQHRGAGDDVGPGGRDQTGQMASDQVTHPMAAACQLVNHRQMGVHVAGCGRGDDGDVGGEGHPVECARENF